MKQLLAGLFLLAGCASAPPDDVAAQTQTEAQTNETAGDDTLLLSCVDDELCALIGQPVSAAPGIIPETARVIGPGDLYPQEYVPNRVNVEHNDAGIVTRLWCG